MPQEKPQPEAFSLYASVTQTTCNLFTRFEKLEPNPRLELLDAA